MATGGRRWYILAMFPDRLQTSRLILRPVEYDDAAAIFESYAQDPEVSRFVMWRPHTSIEDTRAYIASCLAATTFRSFALIHRGGDALVGTFDLRDAGPGRIGFGYVLARAVWGQGLMTEALTVAAEWALSQPGIWRIGDVCDTENGASARVMENAGLLREGLLRRWAVHPNISDVPRDCFIFSKVR
jgi:ribosomal-protein-alanine N-acetyltransferase